MNSQYQNRFRTMAEAVKGVTPGEDSSVDNTINNFPPLPTKVTSYSPVDVVDTTISTNHASNETLPPPPYYLLHEGIPQPPPRSTSLIKNSTKKKIQAVYAFKSVAERKKDLIRVSQPVSSDGIPKPPLRSTSLIKKSAKAKLQAVSVFQNVAERQREFNEQSKDKAATSKSWEENIPDPELSEEQFREKYKHLGHRVDKLWRDNCEEREDYMKEKQKKEKRRKKKAEKEKERQRKLKNLNQTTAKVNNINDQVKIILLF